MRESVRLTIPAAAIPPLDLIDGDPEVPELCVDTWLTDPNSGNPLQLLRTSSPAQVERAVAAAHRVAGGGDAITSVRLYAMERFADALEDLTEQIAVADATSSGVPLTVTRMMAESLPAIVRGAVVRRQATSTRQALEARGRRVELLRLPWGPVGVIAPFNAPCFIAAKKTAYALAAGCPVILKPSEWTAGSADIMAPALLAALTAAGLDPAWFQLLHGASEVGAQLAADPRVRVIAFTGGRSSGTAVAQLGAASAKQMQLELGSNNPAIVRADADIDATAGALLAGFTKLNGQWCEAPRTVLVGPSLEAPLIEALLERSAQLRVGSSLSAATEFGPQAHPVQNERVRDRLRRLERMGARLQSSVECPPNGYFVSPTLVTDAPFQETLEEIFGPVLVVHRVQSDEEAMNLAGRLAGGLAGYVFSTDVEAALALGSALPCGEIKIGGTSLLDLADGSAQGFWDGSGVGGHGDAELLQLFWGARIVGVDDPAYPI
ncbi:MAG TPA: aldehyde dehydrogenase family protein [Candidatus Dormibacteraeota bacterium]|nr:aldehyde dehydrogenase family protein [Candidatus Dormibacteraeota bacterium]